ncbi:hypothetical protein H7J07_04905 [Mycobacterium koreense]|uniref:Uncharacterized protein n=1 Tax=Mycolicibacillus koreensis TaxID=1069220 RepID=A0A7I7SD72_9MYCO|nr:hypothetical protein [Mycolicibacillus koreensis]MCV7247597.1 hypothetical protein [Mycolicibacillus koreensis]OSC32827.1 hypothetical protein B8W67_13995 [Mycolicibacillus koreensis]BBY53975.1 hypothetical protein MKOR_12260 [Mycolicibacillus koreensis]
MADFATWLDTFIGEKGLDLDHRFDVEGPQWGWNSIPLGSVVDVAKQCSTAEQDKIKDTLVAIDFRNGDAMHFFAHLAAEMAR